jgi:hypothetical protein
MLCYIMLCYVMLCYVMLCYIILYYIILYYISFHLILAYFILPYLILFYLTLFYYFICLVLFCFVKFYYFTVISQYQESQSKCTEFKRHFSCQVKQPVELGYEQYRSKLAVAHRVSVVTWLHTGLLHHFMTPSLSGLLKYHDHNERSRLAEYLARVVGEVETCFHPFGRENHKRRHHAEKPGVNWRIILKFILNK